MPGASTESPGSILRRALPGARALAAASLLLTGAARPATVLETAVQTDWSGGPGIPGPVPAWGSGFDRSAGMEWEEPGLLTMLPGEVAFGETVEWPTHAHPGDIDGDGDTDILVVSHEDDLVYLLRNLDGEGTSWERCDTPVPRGAFRLWGGDIDCDGDQDFFCYDMFDDRLDWWENADGLGGEWTPHPVSTGLSSPSRGAASDFDADGDTDLALVESFYSDELLIFENLGGGQSWQQTCVWSGPFGASDDLDTGDIDDDGDIDIAMAMGSGGMAVSWWEHDQGGWNRHDLGPWFSDGGHIALADIDGDGDLDIFHSRYVSASESSLMAVMNLDGQGTDWERSVIHEPAGHRYECLCAEDWDGDGVPEVATGSYGDRSTHFVTLVSTEPSGRGWEERVLSTRPENPCLLRSVDIGGDGRADLLCSDTWGDRLYWWDLSSPSGTLTSSILDTGIAPDWESVHWTCETPPGTDLGLRVRSLDRELQGEWSDTLYAPGSLAGHVSDGDRYFQYRVVMGSEGLHCPPPELHEVSVTWSTMSSAGTAGPASPPALTVTASPCSGDPRLTVCLPGEMHVRLMLFDAAGRMAAVPQDGALPAGRHELRVERLPPGVYTVLLRTGGVSDTARLVLLP